MAKRDSIPTGFSPQKEHGRMPNRTKQRRSGGLTLLLYQRTLHPELFKIYASEQVSRRAYEADIWLVDGGHVISFTSGKHTLTEVIMMAPGEMTDRGLIQTIPCRGEKYHEMTAPGGNIRYMISTQEEQLTQTLYEATKSEIREYASSSRPACSIPSTSPRPTTSSCSTTSSSTSARKPPILSSSTTRTSTR
jgi:hypothetical protein